jgi:hypothetical protein
MSAMTAAELWERGQEGWPRRFPVAQFPNPPLILAGAGYGLASLTDGSARDAGRALFLAGLAAWALEEAIAGANWFRRLMGAGVLAGLAARRGKAS